MNYFVEYRKDDLKIIGYYTEDSVDELKDKSFIKINEEMYRYLRNLEQQGNTFLVDALEKDAVILKEHFCVKETKNIEKQETAKDESTLKEIVNLKLENIKLKNNIEVIVREMTDLKLKLEGGK